MSTRQLDALTKAKSFTFVLILLLFLDFSIAVLCHVSQKLHDEVLVHNAGNYSFLIL